MTGFQLEDLGGPIFESELSKTQQTPTVPVDEPVGWSTSNMGYFHPLKYRSVCADDQWRSLVVGATTGLRNNYSRKYCGTKSSRSWFYCIRFIQLMLWQHLIGQILHNNY